jgi:hypothetical protein
LNIFRESHAGSQGADAVFGFCARCKEYRSDQDRNTWGFDWIDDTPICRKCGAVVDIIGTEDDYNEN